MMLRLITAFVATAHLIGAWYAYTVGETFSCVCFMVAFVGFTLLLVLPDPP